MKSYMVYIILFISLAYSQDYPKSTSEMEYDKYSNRDCYDNWIGDGYCDSSNNNEDCLYDGGDCCPGDCISSEDYDCSEYGGSCDYLAKPFSL